MRVRVKLKFENNESIYISEDGRWLPSQINVQHSNTIDIFNNPEVQGLKGFQLSPDHAQVMSSLDGTYKLFSDAGYPGCITSKISSPDCTVSDVNFIFNFTGTMSTGLFVIFDILSGEYAVDFSLVINRVLRVDIVGNTSPVVFIPVTTADEVSYCVLDITKWSKPNASIKVLNIGTNFISVFTGQNLINFACSENLLDSQMTISPGICEQYADVTMYDRHNTLHKLLSEHLSALEATITIEAIDALETPNTLGVYELSNCNVDGVTSVITVEGRDKSYTFDNINLASLPIEHRTLHDMLTLLFQYAPGAKWKYIDSDTATYCKDILTPDSWFEKGTLYQLLAKICILGMLRIYWYIDSFVVARCY